MVLHHLYTKGKLYTLDTKQATWSCLEEGADEPKVLLTNIRYVNLLRNNLFFGLDQCLGYFNPDKPNSFDELYSGSYTELVASKYNEIYRFRDEKGQHHYIQNEKHYDEKTYLATFCTGSDNPPVTLSDFVLTDRDGDRYYDLEDILDDYKDDEFMILFVEKLRKNLGTLIERYNQDEAKTVHSEKLEYHQWEPVSPLNLFKPIVYNIGSSSGVARDYNDWSNEPMRVMRAPITPPKPLSVCRLDLYGLPLCLFIDGSFGFFTYSSLNSTEGTSVHFGYNLVNLKIKTLV